MSGNRMGSMRRSQKTGQTPMIRLTPPPALISRTPIDDAMETVRADGIVVIRCAHTVARNPLEGIRACTPNAWCNGRAIGDARPTLRVPNRKIFLWTIAKQTMGLILKVVYPSQYQVPANF